MSFPENYEFPPAGTFIEWPGLGQVEIVSESRYGPRKPRELPTEPPDGDDEPTSPILGLSPNLPTEPPDGEEDTSASFFAF